MRESNATFGGGGDGRVANGRRKRQEVKEGEREAWGGRSGGLSCLSAIVAYITRSSRDGMLTRMAEQAGEVRLK